MNHKHCLILLGLWMIVQITYFQWGVLLSIPTEIGISNLQLGNILLLCAELFSYSFYFIFLVTLSRKVQINLTVFGTLIPSLLMLLLSLFYNESILKVYGLIAAGTFIFFDHIILYKVNIFHSEII